MMTLILGLLCLVAALHSHYRGWHKAALYSAFLAGAYLAFWITLHV